MIPRIPDRNRFTTAVALWLALLAASPLTAPFATLDFVPIGSATLALDSAKTKTTHDDTVATQAFAVFAPSAESGSGLPCRAANSLLVGAARHTVLRL